MLQKKLTKNFDPKNFHAQIHEKHDFLGPENQYLMTLMICEYV